MPGIAVAKIMIRAVGRFHGLGQGPEWKNVLSKDMEFPLQHWILEGFERKSVLKPFYSAELASFIDLPIQKVFDWKSKQMPFLHWRVYCSACVFRSRAKRYPLCFNEQ